MIVVAASAATERPARWNLTVPPSPAWPPGPPRTAPDGGCRHAFGRPVPLGISEHVLRTAHPGLPLPPVGHHLVEPVQIQTPVGRVARTVSRYPGAVRDSSASLVAEHQILRGRDRVNMKDIAGGNPESYALPAGPIPRVATLPPAGPIPRESLRSCPPALFPESLRSCPPI